MTLTKSNESVKATSASAASAKPAPLFAQMTCTVEGCGRRMTSRGAKVPGWQALRKLNGGAKVSAEELRLFACCYSCAKVAEEADVPMYWLEVAYRQASQQEADELRAKMLVEAAAKKAQEILDQQRKAREAHAAKLRLLDTRANLGPNSRHRVERELRG